LLVFRFAGRFRPVAAAVRCVMERAIELAAMLLLDLG